MTGQRQEKEKSSIVRIILFGPLLSIAEKQLATDVFDEGL